MLGDGSVGLAEGICVASRARHRQDREQKTGHAVNSDWLKKKNLPVHLVLNSINNLMQLDYNRIGECKVNQWSLPHLCKVLQET